MLAGAGLGELEDCAWFGEFLVDLDGHLELLGGVVVGGGAAQGG